MLLPNMLALLTPLLLTTTIATAADTPFAGTQSDWKGFVMHTDGGTKIVAPKETAEGTPWIWRARFWGHEPQFDVAMLNKGYHVVYCNVGNLYGAPDAVERWNAFYKKLTNDHGFGKKPILEGMSRGGLIIYNWAVANPDKVGAIYGDAPVMDFKSWPGAANGGIKKAYGFKTKEEALAYKHNPVDTLAILAKAKIPIIHVVGDADKTVPIAENSSLAETRYPTFGGLIKVIHKEGVDHHPHSIKDPTPLVEFMDKHALK